MEELYYNIVTFIGGLEPLIKGLIIGLLFILIIMCVRNLIKVHVNPKKPIFKIGQFVLLAILVGITIFFCAHSF